MVVSSILGGLGNQMFQYAMGRALSIRLNSTFQMDITAFQRNVNHQGFELKRIFSLDTEIATEAHVKQVLGWRHPILFRRLLSKRGLAALRGTIYVVEPHFEFWSGVEKISKNCFLTGYWQSERYFIDAIAQIRKDFEFSIPLDHENLEIANRINRVNAVSLHVRRGDYVSNPTNASIYHVCSAKYYRKAIEIILEKIDNPQFFVFSDDMEWVKKNLDFNSNCLYISINQGVDSYKDMQLMSLCQHHIIANSSFGWWGAWLNPRLKKIVVGPSQWFVQPVDTKDLLPAKWLQA